MTLSFTQTIEGKPNYFIEKIWASLLKLTIIGYAESLKQHYEKFNIGWDNENSCLWPNEEITSKLHTIRANRHSRWRAGMDIHFVINNRSPDRFQFAPVVKCAGVQEIWILKFSEEELGVKVDGKNLTVAEVETLAKNDGFDSAADFYKYFFRTSPYPMNFYGKIIHWTDLKY